MQNEVTRELYLTAITGPFVPARSRRLELAGGATELLADNGSRNPLSVRVTGDPNFFDLVFSSSPNPSNQSIRRQSAVFASPSETFVLLENEQLYVRNLLPAQQAFLAINEAYL